MTLRHWAAERGRGGGSVWNPFTCRKMRLECSLSPTLKLFSSVDVMLVVELHRVNELKTFIPYFLKIYFLYPGSKTKKQKCSEQIFSKKIRFYTHLLFHSQYKVLIFCSSFTNIFFGKTIKHTQDKIKLFINYGLSNWELSKINLNMMLIHDNPSLSSHFPYRDPSLL